MGGKLFAGGVALMIGVGLFGGRAEAMCHSNFTCSPGASPTCYFIIQQFEGGDVRRLAVPAGERRGIFGLRPGAEFCSSNQGWPEAGYCHYRDVKMSCD